MGSFLRSFKRVTVVVLGIYWAALVLFIIGTVGEAWGTYCMIMFWLQVLPSKLILEALPFTVRPPPAILPDQFWLLVFVLGSLVNSLLLAVGAFLVTGIYSLAVTGDRKMADKFGHSRYLTKKKSCITRP